MDRIFTVEEMAKKGNTSPRAIRLYVEKGLLEPMRLGRTLCFYGDATQQLDEILRTKRLGFSLEEIRACLMDYDADVIKSAIKRIEELKSDTDIEVAVLKSRLGKIQKRR